MPTQIQATPILYGEDARVVWAQINKKPTLEQIRKAKERQEFFKQVKTRGLKVGDTY